MTWTRLSDDFTERAEFLACSRSARLLLVEMYVWSNRLERDGVIPMAAVRRLTDSEEYHQEVEELLTQGLLDIDPEDRTITLDWSDQEPAEEVKARRAARAAKQKKYRERKSKHERNDHSMCDPRYCPALKKAAASDPWQPPDVDWKNPPVTGNATSNVTGLVTPSRPVPARPLGRDGDRGPEARSAGATRPPDQPGRKLLWSDLEVDDNDSAHRFQPDHVRGSCTYSWVSPINPDQTFQCGAPRDDLSHAHEFEPIEDGRNVCDYCEWGQEHPVHINQVAVAG